MARTEPPRNVSRDRDQDAGDYLHKLMVAQGLSPERLAHLIKAKGARQGYAPKRVHVSPDLLRLIFDWGHQPGPRVKFAISLYFDLRPGQIWEEDAFDEVGAVGVFHPSPDPLEAPAA